MEHAVSVSREEGYVQLFADVWDLAESIVRRFAKQKQSSGEVLAFVEQLIRNAGDKELYADRSGYARKKLSPKEYQVLQYLLEGKSNAAIGETMNISVETVKTHCKNIYKKLNLSSRKEVQKAFH